MQRGEVGTLVLLWTTEGRRERVEYSSRNIPVLRDVAETFGGLINTVVWWRRIRWGEARSTEVRTTDWWKSGELVPVLLTGVEWIEPGHWWSDIP